MLHLDDLKTAEDTIMPEDEIKLSLYIAGWTPNSRRAFANLKKICDSLSSIKCDIEIINLLESPEKARQDQIIAVPTVVKKYPPPVKKIIGDMSDSDKVIKAINLL